MIGKLNFKLIFLHTLAVFLLIMAFNNLAFLYDVDLVEAYAKNGKPALLEMKPQRITWFLIAKQMIAFLGLFIGVGISFILARQQKISIWNIFIVLMLGLMITGSKFYEKFQWLSVRKYLVTDPALNFSINAFIFLGIGFFLFFSNNISYLKSKQR
jgi:hypothetical protein